MLGATTVTEVKANTALYRRGLIDIGDREREREKGRKEGRKKTGKREKRRKKERKRKKRREREDKVLVDV